MTQIIKKDVLSDVCISQSASTAWQQKLAKKLAELTLTNPLLVDQYMYQSAQEIAYPVDNGYLRIELRLNEQVSVHLDVPPKHWYFENEGPVEPPTDPTAPPKPPLSA